MKPCKKCGATNPDQANFCAVCGSPFGKQRTAKGRGRRLAFIVLLAVLVLGTSAAAGWYFFLREDFAAYYQSFSDADVRFENGTHFVDSQLLVTAKEGVSRHTVENLVAGQGGKIVGYISIANDYQIEFSAGKTTDELTAIAARLSADERIEAAELHYALQMDMDSYDYSTDPWLVTETIPALPEEWNDDIRHWDEIHPDGENWWAEAIWLPHVWELGFEFNSVRVGIIDSMFDVSHPDLVNVFASERVYQNPDINSISKEVSGYSHGTHVAGLIAAENNKSGIMGTAQNAELHGFAMYGNARQKYFSVMEWKYAIALMLHDGARIINISMGRSSELLVSAQKDAEALLTVESSLARKTVRDINTNMEQFLQKCLTRYDFLIIKSAGNEEGYYFIKNDTVTDEHPFSYRQVNEEEGGSLPGQLSTDYGILSGIESQKVRDHILVVGALGREEYEDDKGGRYIICSEAYFSNGSDTEKNDPDIFAPGVMILSDYPGGGTTLMDGTSMATPIVSGVAALVWGVNPRLSAMDVRDILLKSAGANHLHERMVNALSAVSLAMASLGEDNSQNNTAGGGTFGTVMGYVYDSRNSMRIEDGGITEDGVVKTAEITVHNKESSEDRTATLSQDGTFVEYLLPGRYTVTATAEGHAPVSRELTVGDNGIYYLAIPVVPRGSVSLADPDDVPGLPPEPLPTSVPEKSGTSEELAYQQFLQDGGYYWEVTCLETPEYALYDIDSDGVKELIIRGKLLNGYYNQDYNDPDYRDMYYSFTYADGAVTYQGRQEYLPLGSDNSQLAEMTFAAFDLVYNYSFSQEELNEIAKGLGAPEGVEVQNYAVSSGPSYWEGTNSWTVDIELWGDDGGYANSGLVLGSTMPVHMWVPWTYDY